MLSGLAAILPLWVLVTPPVFAAVHEQLAAVPAGWTHISTPSDDSSITLQIALPQQNVAEFESKLFAVSTPGSSSHGQFMEGDAVSALLKPSTESNDAVVGWLANAGISGSNVVSDGEWVTFATTVQNANTLLNTTFKNFESEGVTKLRTTEYSVPAKVSSHIDFISPTIFFGKTKAAAALPAILTQRNEAKAVERRLDASCAKLITPQCLKELYNINNYTADPNSGSRIAFGSFLNESARTIDLSLFETQQNIPQQQFSVQLINGATNLQAPSGDHGEANLDVQYIIGISHPLPVISYITGGSP